MLATMLATQLAQRERNVYGWFLKRDDATTLGIKFLSFFSDELHIASSKNIESIENRAHEELVE